MQPQYIAAAKLHSLRMRRSSLPAICKQVLSHVSGHGIAQTRTFNGATVMSDAVRINIFRNYEEVVKRNGKVTSKVGL